MRNNRDFESNPVERYRAAATANNLVKLAIEHGASNYTDTGYSGSDWIQTIVTMIVELERNYSLHWNGKNFTADLLDWRSTIDKRIYQLRESRER